MSASNFKTQNDTYRKLIGNGLLYRVPRFQRDYSWGTEEWQDLWEDIQDILPTSGTKSGGGSHYLGYLVLQSQDDKTFDVIDGQQRLTTLSLLALAVLKNLKKLIDTGTDPEANKQRFDQLNQTYIGYRDPVTLTVNPKLTLNRNNNEYYATFLVELGQLPKRGYAASVHALRKSFEWFDAKVAEHVRGATDCGRALATLIEEVADRVFFTVIHVSDELNAYKVFETLNARGVRLSSTDLLKNYLFSILDKQGRRDQLEDLAARWERLVSCIDDEAFPEFFRVYWLSNHSFVRHSELFRKVRGEYTTAESVFGLIRSLEASVESYVALTSPEGSDWSPRSKQDAQTLKTFGVRQPFPLLLAARACLPEKEFEAVLHGIVVISVRYNVIGQRPPAEQEREYQQVARELRKRKYGSATATLQALHSLYPSDQAFESDFSERRISATSNRNKQVLRYLLGRLEAQAAESVHTPVGDKVSIEHILPQHPSDAWEVSNRDVEEQCDRLGNLTLLSPKDNVQLGNLGFDAKKAVFASSEFCLTREVAEQSEWNAARIQARSQRLAKYATAIWRLQQLDTKQRE